MLSFKLQYLRLSSQETLPSESGWTQEIFATTYLLFNFSFSPPSLSYIKETGIQTGARRFFGTQVHPLLDLLAFWIKLLFPAQHLVFWLTDLPNGEQYEFELWNTFSTISQMKSVSIYNHSQTYTMEYLQFGSEA